MSRALGVYEQPRWRDFPLPSLGPLTNKTVIVDIDGVCFNPEARLERCKDANGKIDKERAFSNEEVAYDLPIKGAAEATRMIRGRFNIVYLTGRSEFCRKATVRGLIKHGFAVDEKDMIEHISGGLLMCPLGCFEPDHVIKRQLIIDKHRGQIKFVAAIDVDHSGELRQMYLSLGIPHFHAFEEFFESDIWKGR